MSEEKTPGLLVLVDGSSYLYRAYHALPPLTTSHGEATGAVYGVANMLRTLLKSYDPDYIAVVFDAKGKTFRDDLYAAYKAHRPPMPEELGTQVEPLLEVVRALGLPCLAVEGVEADDVIGTLASRATAAGLRTVISTGDKDLAQLVDQHVTLVNTMTGQTLDVAGVTAKFGLGPDRIVDYLALVGDTSDNIPGVPGVGPKTAAKWLNEYGSLDGLIARADTLPGKIGERLRTHLAQLPLARALATIRRDVALALDPADLRRAPPDTARLRALYQRLEFRRWLEELLDEERAARTAASGIGPQERAAATPADRDYRAVWSAAELDAWIARIRAAGLFAFDTETTGLDYIAAEIVGLSLAVRPGEAAYVPLAHRGAAAPPAQLDREFVLARLRPLLEDPALGKLGQNLKYDISVLASYGIAMRGARYDTMLESYVLDSTATRHDMDSLALKYLGTRTIRYEDIAGRGAAQVRFDEVPVEAALPYAAQDADVALQLHHALYPRLRAVEGLHHVYTDIEMPLVPVLSQMERNGVLIDAELLGAQSAELARRMEEIERQAHAAAGTTFNLSSPKQLQEILFDKLRLPVVQKTPKGQPSTAEFALQELALDFPLPGLILDYRSLSKLKTTYTDRLPEQIHPRTGRVHTSYHQAVTATGRLSSSDPNLQNIPVRSDEGRRIRSAFIAPPGYRIVAADYSQIELRILAHLSADEGLLRAFRSGGDIHRTTAAEIFGTGVEEVTPEQRRSAKAINFGLVYGMSAFGLGRQLGIERGAAQAYVDRYFARYTGVQRFMDATRRAARERGYVETLCGRRLHLPEINSANAQRRQYAERAAINAPMQGSAADIIKLAMIRAARWLADRAGRARMIMQVHDELVFEVAEGEIQEALESIREAMAGAFPLTAPLEVDIGVGRNWDEAH